MLVQHILTFIKNLKSIKNLRPCDQDFVKKLSEKFNNKLKQAELDKEKDIPFLLKCLEERWNNTIDSDDNYLLCPNEPANLAWIKLAQNLASISTLSATTILPNYLHLLMPTIKNDKDFNNLSFLSTTSDLKHLYLGHDKKTLYKKKGLCSHLLNHDCVLSTRRALIKGQLSALSISELSRLKSCEKDVDEFSIDKTKFKNFWDFLKKRVFVRLQIEGKMPVDLLPHFLELINDYYIYKNSGVSYMLFRKKLKNFFNLLYQNKLEDINYFYGIKIQYKKKEYYLIEFLIIMNKAKSYVLDNHLSAISTWLFTNYPVLKWFALKLGILSAEVKSMTVEESAASRVLTQEEQCLGLLLSLFTTKFNYLPFSGGKVIKVWDIANSVVFEAGEIFSLFEPLLAGEKGQLLPKYIEAMDKYITPGRFDTSHTIPLTRWKSVSKWYEQAYERTLAPWYQPELLMQALLQATHPAGTDFKKKINSYLDQLIHIYVQDKSKLLKELKINVLFFEFFNKLSNKEQGYIQFLIDYAMTARFERNFCSNCLEHIINHLTQIPLTKIAKKTHFFPATHHLDRSKLVLPLDKFDNLNKLIDALKIKLESSEFNLDTDSLNKLLSYIRKLTCPIWAIDGSEELQYDTGPSLYMGGFTS